MTRLPDRKRQKDEIKRLRVHNAMAARPPIAAIKGQAAHGFLLFLGYLLSLAAGPGLPVALFIAVRKPRSRHHAALMFILAVLVLVFGIRYYLSQADAA